MEELFRAMVVKGILFSFIAEPLLVQLGFYKLIKWNYAYSFPIYIFLGLSARWIVKKTFIIARRG